MSPHIFSPAFRYPEPVAISPSAFIPYSDQYDFQITTQGLQHRAALTQQVYYAPVHLPNNVTAKRLTLYGHRDDALADMEISLIRTTRAGADQTMASVLALWEAGEGSGEDTDIDYAVIDNENYHYTIWLRLKPNDAVGDVIFRDAVIDWT